MMRHISKYIATFFVAALLLLTACVPQKQAELDLTTRKKAEVDRTVRESEKAFRKGDFDSALGIYGAALRKYPGDPGLLKYYIEAAEDIRDAADNAFDKEEFALSGRTYAVLLRNFPHFKEIVSNLSFDRKYLRARLEECSDRLSRLALMQYRLGNLTAAIALWKNILEFDPGNAGVKKAIDTVSLQLKNLKQGDE